jgi:hypothetical protein
MVGMDEVTISNHFEVVRELTTERDRYRAALLEAHRQLSRFDYKGPKQLGRAMMTIERACPELAPVD